MWDSGGMRRFTVRHFLAALAWLGLALAPLATPAGAMVVTMEIAASAIEATAMPDGMPCCPETQKKPDCAQDCPFMAMCAVKVFPSATGTAVAAPLSFATA